jgi:hypothetical protein
LHLVSGDLGFAKTGESCDSSNGSFEKLHGGSYSWQSERSEERRKRENNLCCSMRFGLFGSNSFQGLARLLVGTTSSPDPTAQRNLPSLTQECCCRKGHGGAGHLRKTYLLLLSDRM